MNNDLSCLKPFCEDIKQNKYKSVTKCVEVHYTQFKWLIRLYSWEKINDYIYKETNLKKNHRYYQQIVSGIKARNKDKPLDLHNDKLPLNIKTQNIEHDFSVDPRFYDMNNITEISYILIKKYHLTYDEVIALGIETIQDSMTIFNRIKKYCDKNKAEKSVFDKLLNKL